MNTDKQTPCKAFVLSVFIRVHLWPFISFFQRAVQPARSVQAARDLSPLMSVIGTFVFGAERVRAGRLRYLLATEHVGFGPIRAGLRLQ